MTRTPSSSVDRAIVRLALPTLATLLAEPTLVFVDSVMVGRLGTVPLAGLSLAATILTTLVGICIFLSYATTASTARAIGAGQPKRALRYGVDGLWVATALGIVLAAALMAWTDPIINLFGPEPDVAHQAARYLQTSAWGLPGMLIVLAGTGTLRGLLDAKTPLYVATAGALANIPLNFVLIYTLDLKIAGAGLGTAIAQTLMGVILGAVVMAKARREGGVALLPTGAGVLSSLTDAVPLIIRTLSLRLALLITVWSATALGTTALAAHQIVTSTWNFAAYGLDSLAIAAQALVGQALGRADADEVRAVLNRCLAWGLRVGAVVGLGIAALSWILPRMIVEDPAVSSLTTQTLWICAATMPIAAIAWMLDGVLIGAGDTPWLAWLMIVALVVYVPVVALLAGPFSGTGPTGLLWLWAGYAVIHMGTRALTLWFRSRSDAWLKLGMPGTTRETE